MFCNFYYQPPVKQTYQIRILLVFSLHYAQITANRETKLCNTSQKQGNVQLLLGTRNQSGEEITPFKQERAPREERIQKSLLIQGERINLQNFSVLVHHILHTYSVKILISLTEQHSHMCLCSNRKWNLITNL